MLQIDFDSCGFEWIDCHDSSQSVLSYLRKSKDGTQLVACAFNFTPVPRENYRIGVPKAGFYREAINSDAELYGGSNVGNRGGVHSEPVSWMGRANSIPMALPPLAGVVMVLEPAEEAPVVAELPDATTTEAREASGPDADALAAATERAVKDA